MGVDIAQFLVSIELMSKYRNLSDLQVQELRNSFLEAYFERGPSISEKEISFYEKKIFERYAKMPDDSLHGPGSHQARFIKAYAKEKVT